MKPMKLDIQMFATHFNNTELTNIFYNNNELDKMYFNDTLVFEKYIEPTVYKRRIDIGDDLRNKTIEIIPHTNTVYQFLRDYIDNNQDTAYASIVTVENEILDPNYQKGGYIGITEYDTSGIQLNYEFYNGSGAVNFLAGDNENNIEIKDKVDIPFNDNLSVISAINDVNPVYRWLYIEDPNIRPLQAGDILTNNTVLYFNFPDDLGIQAINSNNPERFTEDVVYCSNNFRIYGEVNGSKYKIYVSMDEDNRTIYSSDFSNIEINSSFMSLERFVMSTEINSTNEHNYLLNKDYILVDTTTLSTGGGHGHG